MDDVRNDALLKEIKAQATASLVVGIIGLLCLGIILGPFAIYRGAKARRLIRETGVGGEHNGTALAGMILGIIAVVSFIGFVLYRLSVS